MRIELTGDIEMQERASTDGASSWAATCMSMKPWLCLFFLCNVITFPLMIQNIARQSVLTSDSQLLRVAAPWAVGDDTNTFLSVSSKKRDMG